MPEGKPGVRRGSLKECGLCVGLAFLRPCAPDADPGNSASGNGALFFLVLRGVPAGSPDSCPPTSCSADAARLSLASSVAPDMLLLMALLSYILHERNHASGPDAARL